MKMTLNKCRYNYLKILLIYVFHKFECSSLFEWQSVIIKILKYVDLLSWKWKIFVGYVSVSIFLYFCNINIDLCCSLKS